MVLFIFKIESEQKDIIKQAVQDLTLVVASINLCFILMVEDASDSDALIRENGRNSKKQKKQADLLEVTQVARSSGFPLKIY